MDGPSDRPRLEPRQRWRLVARRAPDAPSLTQRELAEAWEAGLARSGLPVAWTDAATPRVRLTFGAALPLGVAAEAELLDVFLTERLPIWRVRDGLAEQLPEGWTLVDLYDVWLAGPPLAGRVVAADYRIDLAAQASDGRPVEASAVEAAAERLRGARQLPRERTKGGGVVSYDLRPLLDDVRVAGDGPPVVLRVRTRFHPELGTGRPEEVVAALAEEAGLPLQAVAVVRERLLLAGEDGNGGDA